MENKMENEMETGICRGSRLDWPLGYLEMEEWTRKWKLLQWGLYRV